MDNKYKLKMSLIENTAKRIPVCIVVDCSGSMKNEDGTGISRIDRVNQGIELFYRDSREDKKARNALEVLIIGVGNEANVISEFSSIKEAPPKLKFLKEKGDLEKGITLGLSMLDERKKIYDSHGVSSYQPWLVVMSDGAPTNDFNTAKSNLTAIQRKVRGREERGKLSVFPVFVQGKPYYDERMNTYRPIKLETYQKHLHVMQKFTNYHSRVINLDLTENNSFKELFQFLHRSASSIASGKGFIADKKFGDFRENKERKITFSEEMLKDILEIENDNSNDNNLDDIDENKINITQKSNDIEHSNIIIADEIKNNSLPVTNKEDSKITEESQKILKDFYNNIEQSKTIVNYNDDNNKKNNNDIKLFVNDKEVSPSKIIKENKTILKILLQRKDNISIKKNDMDIMVNSSTIPIKESGIYNIEITEENIDVILLRTIEVHTIKKSEKSFDDYDEKLKKIDWSNI